ncbi:hypothetical protein ASD45_11095 [Pseudolabrys sp. Root1462]|nr:hypothetical protein ASD45_11095 [Pseudolabrys sp. Root1462]
MRECIGAADATAAAGREQAAVRRVGSNVYAYARIFARRCDSRLKAAESSCDAAPAGAIKRHGCQDLLARLPAVAASKPAANR